MSRQASKVALIVIAILIGLVAGLIAAIVLMADSQAKKSTIIFSAAGAFLAVVTLSITIENSLGLF
jgi:uncharacterized membrane protein YeaQ/YmgE (transglycosylase-associated protein family)